MAAYSLGASKEKIQRIFDEHASYQKPLPPSITTITRENYKDYLGQAEAYTSFLQFFQSEIEKNGHVETIRRWVWTGDMLARTVGGAYHPLIHIGYSLEFNIPGIAAEGLAMAACTEDHLVVIIPNQPELQTALLPTQAQVYAENATSTARGYMTHLVDQLSTQINTHLGISEKVVSPSAATRSMNDPSVPAFLKENSLIGIFNDIRKDPLFDNLVKSSDNLRSQIILKNKVATDRIRDYVNQWPLEENSKDIQAKFKDLYTLVTVALGSTGLKGQDLKLDFFMMHALTSSEFIHQYIVNVAPSEAVSLLRAHLATTLVYFVSNGRPIFDVDALIGYKIEGQMGNNAWLQVMDKSLDCMEPHVIKVVRACAVGQIIYGPNQDARLNEVWLKVAHMANEKNGEWDFSGLGFQ